MRFIYFGFFFFRTADQYLDLGVPLHQINDAHDGIDCFPAASDPYVDPRSVHRGGIFQISVVDPIDEIRKPWMGGSFRPVDHDLGSVHQLIQSIPEILITVIHTITPADPDMSFDFTLMSALSQLRIAVGLIRDYDEGSVLQSVSGTLFFLAVVTEAMSFLRIVPHLSETVLYCSSERECTLKRISSQYSVS